MLGPRSNGYHPPDPVYERQMAQHFAVADPEEKRLAAIEDHPMAMGLSASACRAATERHERLYDEMAREDLGRYDLEGRA